MIKNYLALAARNLRRNPGYALINILGLATGTACCLLISLYVLGEVSVDSFQSRSERLYRLNKVVTPDQGGVERHAISSGQMGPTLVSDFPEMEAVVRFLPWFDDILLSWGPTSVKLTDLAIADANFFEVFDFELVRGSPGTVLQAPFSMVLSQTAARRLFGEADPIGERVVGLEDREYTVTGVAADPPLASHITFDALVSWSTTVPGSGGLEYSWMNNWYTQVLYTYVLTHPETDPKAIEARLPAFTERHFPERSRQYELYLQRFDDIYLGSSDLLHTRGLRGGSRTHVLLFGGIALAVLLIACVNFMNLSTARASRRAVEVGIRKAVGASRGQLARQFIAESLLTAAIAVVIALAAVQVILPQFEMFTGRELSYEPLSLSWLAAALIGGTLAAGFLSGAYPSLMLSRFDPAAALKSGRALSGGGAAVRRVLVTTQFAASIGLIAGTLIVFKQVEYLQSRDLGFDPDRVVVVPTSETAIQDRFTSFKEAVLTHANVKSAAGSANVPGEGMMGFEVEPEGAPEDETFTVWTLRVDDDDLLETYDMELLAGRYFDDALVTDSSSVVINRALVEMIGWDDPVGKRLDISGEVSNGRVIGVVENFHYESLHHAIDPLAVYISPRGGNLAVRLAGDDISGTLAFLKQMWEQFESRYPFEFYFLDESFARQYDSERRLVRTIGIFALLAIGVACLGLFGLAAFTAEQRTKEIGVRKVLGASASQIVVLLSKDFLRLIALAFVVAAPLTYVATSEWLKAFAYRTDPGIAAFLVAGAGAMLLALMTISYQSLKAAHLDPVRSLRHE